MDVPSTSHSPLPSADGDPKHKDSGSTPEEEFIRLIPEPSFWVRYGPAFIWCLTLCVSIAAWVGLFFLVKFALSYLQG
jgi:hypothetical protein